MSAGAEIAGRVALVTGATGFIGGALTRRLLAEGAQVHAVTRGDPLPVSPGMRWWRADLVDASAARRVLAEVRPDWIFHLGGLAAGGRELPMVQATFEANFLPVLNLLLAAHELNVRLVLAGSLEEPAPDGSWPVPGSPYAASKMAGALYSRLFHALYQTQVVWLRLFMVYGPRQPDARKLIPYVTLSLLRGEAPRLSSGTRPVDWVFIDDVVDAFLAAAVTPGADGRSLDVGSGELVTVRAVIEELVRQIDPSRSPLFGALADRPLEQVSVADVPATTATLGWMPRVKLRDGLARTVAWYQEQVSRHPRKEMP
jgi:nucleoside-diphosphate-sugar epimerase